MVYSKEYYLKYSYVIQGSQYPKKMTGRCSDKALTTVLESGGQSVLVK